MPHCTVNVGVVIYWSKYQPALFFVKENGFFQIQLLFFYNTNNQQQNSITIYTVSIKPVSSILFLIVAAVSVVHLTPLQCNFIVLVGIASAESDSICSCDIIGTVASAPAVHALAFVV